MLNTFQFIDLTHPLTPEAPTWNGSCGFCLEIKKDYDKMFRVQQIKMHAGVGTHMDAPCHCIPGGRDISEIPVEQLIIAACVVDVSDRAHADYEVTVQDILEHEERHGAITQGALLIVHTGWWRRWSDPDGYRNADSNGKMHFPAVSKEAAEWLLKREVCGLAIDTLSPDCADERYPVHHLLLGAGKYIIENITGCDQMPPKGAFVIALPLRAVDATECPIRIVGIKNPAL